MIKEIEENNRMGKIRNLFKKMGDIKGTFHARMGTMKNRKCKDLTEAEEIKRLWQENMEKLYKKDLKDLNNHSDVLTHQKLDVPECEVKCALGSITMNKASGSNGIPSELSKILREDAVKVVHSVCQKIWKNQQRPEEWKRLVFIPIPKKDNAKECSNYQITVLISYASKITL